MAQNSKALLGRLSRYNICIVKWEHCENLPVWLCLTTFAGWFTYLFLSEPIRTGTGLLKFNEYVVQNTSRYMQDRWQSTKAINATESLFVDEYFEPILSSFKNGTSNSSRKHFRNGTVPQIFFVVSDKLSNKFWTSSFRHMTEGKCPHRCILTDNFNEYATSDAILIYLRHVKNLKSLNERLPNRDPRQPWIVFSNEAHARASDHHLPFKSMNGVFNRTMLYRRDSDIVWTHGFIVSKKDAHYLPSSWHINGPPIQQLPFHQRKPVIAFISNCASSRMKYVKELRKHIPVDIVGKCGKFKCGKSRYVQHDFRVEKDECLLKVAKKYLFYLSFENDICEDYASEKVYNIQYYPVVPVVYGGADYDKLLPPNSYINALKFSPEQLASHLKSIAADEERYNSILSWREQYEVSTVGGERIYCQLCTKLYDPNFYTENIYTDFHSWLVKKSNCRGWSVKFNVTEVLNIP